MEAARANWTDSRLDDLNDRVGQIDEKMDAGFRRADEKMDAGFKRADEKMDAGFKRADEKMDAGFNRLNDRIDKLQHSMIVVGGGLIAAMLTVLAAMLGMVITMILTHF